MYRIEDEKALFLPENILYDLYYFKFEICMSTGEEKMLIPLNPAHDTSVLKVFQIISYPYLTGIPVT